MHKSFEEKRCLTCAGSGKIMGGGLIIRDCHACEGIGKLYKFKEELPTNEKEIKTKSKRKRSEKI